MRREGGGRGRRRRRAHRGGGGGGGFSPVAASGSSTAGGPPFQQRGGPPGPGPAAAAAIEEEAPGVFILGRSRRRAARGALQRSGRRAGCAGPTAPPGWNWLAGGQPGSARGWLGSGPRSARRRLPLPRAHSSSELHRRPSPAPQGPG